ncbi:hypothetical protein lerEdw1_005558, partial [Lerista edwardsae]
SFTSRKPSHVELTGANGRLSTTTVSQFVAHRGFSSWDAMPNNDLGLILLAQPIDLRRKDMWPVCVPQRKESPDVMVQCNIIKRGLHGEFGGPPTGFLSTQIFLLILRTVNSLQLSWDNPNYACYGIKMLAVTTVFQTASRVLLVPVGSPMICRDPARKYWELLGIVSQSLRDCTAPILTTQVGLADASEEMHSGLIPQALTHPRWMTTRDFHNVELLQLEKLLNMRPLIVPTCLSDEANMIDDFKDCWLPGWTVLEGE